MMISEDSHFSRDSLNYLAEQARLMDQIAELQAIASQIDEWNRSSSVERVYREYSAFKSEHDRLDDAISRLWEGLRESYAATGLAPWISYKAPSAA